MKKTDLTVKIKTKDKLILKDRLKRNKKKVGTCWFWTKSTRSKKKPYGCTTIYIEGKKKTIAVHRLAYILYKGDVPESKYILHKCHNPLCFRPSHLYAGSAKENTKDMFDAGRQNTAKGSRISKQLTEEQVNTIKHCLVMCKDSPKRLAELFHVSETTIKSIKHLKTWKHVDRYNRMLEEQKERERELLDLKKEVMRIKAISLKNDEAS